MIIALKSCTEDTFMPNTDPASYGKPTDLLYADILNAREYSKLKSGIPHVDTQDLVPSYEIISGKNGEGELLDDTFMSDVTIDNVDLTAADLDYSTAGRIIIATGNKFGPGDYYFTIKVSTELNGKMFETTFDDIFHIHVGPQLVKDLLYSPIAQNLVVGTDKTTSKPYLLSGNPNVTFALTSHLDIFQIDTTTGVISLVDGYTVTEDETHYPSVQVTSNLSKEITEFQGGSFLMLVISNEPVVLPRQTIYFFYPTLQSENTLYGYRKEVITQGAISYGKTWIQNAPSPLALAERPSNVTGIKSLVTNIVIGKDSNPHESDVIINSQDLTKYSLGYDVTTVFYTKNMYVEYLPDGSTPTELEIYYSLDYDGDNSKATWVQINDQIKCEINNDGKEFIGTPYPGDQKLTNGDPDGRKDSTHNPDNKWVRNQFDLNNFKTEKNFTLKFKFASYFEGQINYTSNEGRGGRYYISDVHFKASEE